MSESASEKRRRLRLVTLAEFVALAGLLIGAATLYLNWSDRDDARRSRESEQQAEAKAGAQVTLTATVEEDGRALLVADKGHEVQRLTLRFPTRLGVAARTTTGAPRIEADWIAAPILRLTDGGSDDRDGSVPVLVTARVLDGDRARSVTDTYDLVWRISGRALRGREFRLEALRLRERGGSGATIDAAARDDLPAAR